MTVKFPILVNAEHMRRTHPTTFSLPSQAKRLGLLVGDFAKIATGGERFWVEITQKIKRGVYVGRVDNDLIHTAAHGLSSGDFVNFAAVNIYDISKKEDHE